jgi:FKBP-type peptidyl-prolyl cis-trans isomerase
MKPEEKVNVCDLGSPRKKSSTMGVEKEIIKEGDGATFPSQGQELVMHYTGTLEDGTVFDSSVRKGRPFKFRIGIGAVIQGWDEVNIISEPFKRIGRL